MRSFSLLLALGLVLAGCKQEDEPVEPRPVRTIAVDLKPIGEDRHAIGEVKPRYESDLSFRVAGKVLSRLVDVGASGQARRHAGDARHPGLSEPPALSGSGRQLRRGRARRSAGQRRRAKPSS